MMTLFSRQTLQYIFLICILFSALNVRADEKYEVIIHPHAINKKLSVNTLRAIFGMRLQTWPDGTKIHVFVLADSSKLHQKFVKGVLNVFPYQLRSAWDRLVFSGIGQAPVKVSSVEEMRVRVAKTPGAIGYLWKENIDETVDILQVN